jgi:hypothetical protein
MARKRFHVDSALTLKRIYVFRISRILRMVDAPTQ